MLLFFLLTLFSSCFSLQVSSILPGSSQLTSRQSVTILFTSPVIALGQDTTTNPSLPPHTDPLSPIVIEPQLTVPLIGRWVTTTIYRLDLNGSLNAWPTDLAFTLQVKKDLTSWDGTPVNLTRFIPPSYTTSPLNMYLGTVTSPQAQAVTEGVYDPCLPTPSARSGICEVPPDASVTISFSNPVHLDAIRLNLVARCPSLTDDIAVASAQPCFGAWSVDTCANVTFSQALPAGEQCSIRLAEGTTYHPFAGPVTTAPSIEVNGLFPFVFPYRSYGLQSLASNRFALLLRHGLADETSAGGDPVAALQAALQIDPAPEGPVTLTRMSPSSLVLEGPWSARDSFTLSFGREADTVRSGFDMPFLGSTQEGIRLATETFPPLLYDFATPNAHNGVVSVGDSAYSSNWTVIARNDSSYDSTVIAGWTMDSVDDVLTALRVDDAGVSSSSEELGPPTVSRSLDPLAVDAVQTLTLPTGTLFGTSGVFFRRLSACRRSSSHASARCYNIGSDAFVVRTPWAVHTMGRVIFVTDTETGQPVAGATVTVQWRRKSRPSVTGVTDADGLLSFDELPEAYAYPCDVVVSKDGALFLARSLQVGESSDPEYTARLAAVVTTARRLHRAGEDVHLKGYLKEFDGTGKPTSFPPSVRIRGTWRRSGSVEERTTTIVAPVDGVRGSFDGVLPILANAEYGEASIVVEAMYDADTLPVNPDTEVEARPAKRIRGVAQRARHRLAQRLRQRSIVEPDEPYYGGGGGGDYGYGYADNTAVGSTTVVIADPRIPTATLDVSVTEPVYRQADGVTLVGTLATYIGTPIAGASVNVVWRLTGMPAPALVPFYGYPELYSRGVASGDSSGAASEADPVVGSFTITSDNEGSLLHSFVLPDGVSVPSNANLAFEVSFVGPTRELITAEAGVPVRESELEVTLSLPSTSLVIPGQSFVATSNVLDVDGAPVAGVSVDLHLYRLATAARSFNLTLTADAQGAVLVASQAVVTSGDTAGVTSVLQLPSTGVHAVVAVAVDAASHESVRAVSIGRSAESWSSSPLGAWVGGSVSSARSEYSDGEAVTVAVMPPFSPCTLFVRFGRNEARTMPCPVADQLTTVNVGTMDAAGCGESCTVHAAFIAPRGDKGLADDVPTRASFDPEEPAAVTASVLLSRAVPNDFAIDGELTVTSSVPSGNPGDEVFVTVEGAGADAEVHLFVVDEKILDLSPHPLVSVADVMHSQLSSFRVWVPNMVSEAWLVSHAYVTDLLASWDRRVRIFPWLNPQAYYHSSSDPLDLTDDEFFAPLYAKITEFPWSWSYGAPVADGGEQEFADGGDESLAPTVPMMMRMESDDKVGGDGAGGDAGGDTAMGESVRGESVYVVLSATALADPSGLVRFRVVLPDNLSTFKLRALAVSADGSAYGSAEGELVSSRFINLEPSVPRIVRVGDVFVAGTTVTLSSMDQGDRTVRVSLTPDCSNVDLLSPQEVKVSLNSTSPVRVEWAMRAGVVGTGNVRLAVEDASLGVVDSVDATFDVQGWQEPVTVGTSFALRADEATEGVQVPDHVPGSGSLTIAAGVGRLPAAKAIAAKLQEAVTDRRVGRDPSAMELVGATAPLACLSTYASDAVKANLDEARAAAEAAADLLVQYTNPSPWAARDRVGLVMFPPRTTWWWSSQDTPRPNLQLNAFALFLHRLLLSAGLSEGIDSLGKGGNAIADQWRSAVDRAVGLAVQDAKEAGRSHIADLEGLTAAYLALGVRHTFGSDVAAEDTSYVSLDMLVGQRDRLSYQGRAMLALALAYEDVYATERDAIVATLTDALRIQGRTAYIARGEGAASSDMLASARLLAVQSILSRVGSSTGLPWDKLANGVASLGESTDARTSGYYFPVSRSAQDNTYALLSLATYDAAVGSDEPDATALVVLSSNSNRFVVVSEHFTSPADDPVTETISLATLAADARLRIAQASPPTSVVTDGPLVDASLEFGADGTAGELSFTVTMDYVPAALPTSPVYRGFTVTKVIRALDPLTGEPTGEPLTSARSGDQVVVTIDVHSPDDVADVLLVDPVPGCLEPVSADGAPQGASGGDDGGSRPWGWWWYQTWSLQEARADSVFAHSSWFRAGTHSLQYVALVVTPGTFVLPPTKVSAMLQPELLGLSAGGEFVATPVSASATQLLEAATAAAEAGDVRCFDEEPVPTLDDDFEEEKGDTFEGIGGRGDEPVDRADDESSSGDLSPGIVALLVILALVVVAAGSAAAYVLGRRRNRKRISSFVEDPVAARKVGGAGETGKGSAAGVTRRGASPSPSRAARHHRSSSRTRSGGASKHHRRPLIT